MKIMNKKIVFLIALFIITCSCWSLVNVQAADNVIWQEMDVSTYRENKGEKENYTYPELGGYVFSGWYEEKNGDFIDVDCVTGTAFAKFVKEDVLSIKAQITTDTEVDSEKTDFRMITSIDSLNYDNVGFQVKILNKTSERWTRTAYDTLAGYEDDNKEVYTPSVFSDISKYFVAHKIKNVPNRAFLNGITITPMWVTLDGTTVKGVTRCVTIHEGIGKDASIISIENEYDRDHVYHMVDKAVKENHSVAFDVTVDPEQEIELSVLGDGTWNKEYFTESYKIEGTQSIEVSIPESIDDFVLYAKYIDTSSDLSEATVTFENIRIMGTISEAETDSEETITDTSYGEVWSAPSTVKISQDDTDYAEKGEASLVYEAVRNEYENKQLIITAAKDISSFELIATDLKSGDNVISSDNVEVYVEKYTIDCEDSLSAADWATAYEKTSMPDALIPMEAAANYQENTIATGQNGALWVTLYVPENAVAGTYTGIFQLVMKGANGTYSQDIPVSLKVYNYTLTDAVTAKTLFSWRYARVAAGELDGSIDMMTSYYEFFRDYRISLQALPLETLSADEYAEMIVKYFDDFTTYSLLSSIGNVSIGITDYQEEVIEQVLAIAKVSSENNKNFFEKAMIYTIDEPDLTTDTGRNSVINQSKCLYNLLNYCVTIIEADTNGTYDVLKSMEDWENMILNIPNIIPISNTTWLCGADYNDDSTVQSEVKTFLATMTADDMPSLCLCPLFTGYMEKDSGSYKNSWTNIQNLQSTYGFDLWWYGCVGPEANWPTYHILDSNLLSARTLSWLQLKYNVSGNLYWDAAAYTADIGEHYNQYMDIYGTGKRSSVAGDGFLAYPGAAYGVYGAIPSMRLMSIRDGMEEYEILNDVKDSYTSSEQTSEMFTNFYSQIADSTEKEGSWLTGYDYVYETYISNMKADSAGWFDSLRTTLLCAAENLTTTGTDGISDLLGYDISYSKEPYRLTQSEYRADNETHMLFSFESYKDIIGTALSVSKNLGETGVNKEQKYISHGKASWMIEAQGEYGTNDSYPYVKLQCMDDDFADSTFITSAFSAYDKLLLDVYNDSDEVVRIKWSMTVLDNAGNSVETEPAYFALQPHEWTICEYSLIDGTYDTYLMLDDVQYLTITFLTQKENKDDMTSKLYIDNLRGHALDSTRETNTYTTVFADGVGFENMKDVYSFAGYISTNRLDLSRISYEDANIEPRDSSFGEYAMLGVGTDAVWPKFTAKLDKTYSAGTVLRFWMYIDVDESVSTDTTYRIEASGHSVSVNKYKLNQWMLVDVKLLSDTNQLSVFINFDKDNTGWYSVMGKASVHVYMDNFQIYEGAEVQDKTTVGNGTVVIENKDYNQTLSYTYDVSVEEGDWYTVKVTLSKADSRGVWLGVFGVSGNSETQIFADNAYGTTYTIRYQSKGSYDALKILVKNFNETDWGNVTVTLTDFKVETN